jgi:hypothetical protein
LGFPGNLFLAILYFWQSCFCYLFRFFEIRWENHRKSQERHGEITEKLGEKYGKNKGEIIFIVKGFIFLLFLILMSLSILQVYQFF